MRLSRPPRSMLATVPVIDLHAEIRRRERLLAALKRKHAAIMAKLERLEAGMRDLEGARSARGVRTVPRDRRGATGRPPPRTRARNAVPLHRALHALLKNNPMRAADAGEALLHSGYRTTSKNFRQVIALTFIKHPDLFVRVARGMYRAR